MRIAITGTTGRVGAALARYFSAEHEVIPLPRSLCNLSDPDSLAGALQGLECKVFLNPAGVTSLEACEDDPVTAWRVNASAPEEIAGWAAARNTKVFHFSTDYVFAGRDPGLRREDESPEPLSVYGRSKLAGEERILSCPGNCVIRVSWVFGADRPSFIDKIHDDALAGRQLMAVDDKYSLPTCTEELSRWVDRLIGNNATGIIHACQSGDPATWHDLASTVVAEMHACGKLREIPVVERLKLSEITSFRAERPRFTSMDTSRLARFLDGPPRMWGEAVREYIRAK